MLNLRDDKQRCAAIIQEIVLRLDTSGCAPAIRAVRTVFRSSVARQHQHRDAFIALAAVLRDAASVASMADCSGSSEAIYEAALACEGLDRDTVRVTVFNLINANLESGHTLAVITTIENLDWPEQRQSLAGYFGKRLHDLGHHLDGEMLLSLLPQEAVKSQRLDAYVCQLDRGDYRAALGTACFIPAEHKGDCLAALAHREEGRRALEALDYGRTLRRLDRRCGWPSQVES